jgi:molybdate transport system substrate-binding protein
MKLKMQKGLKLANLKVLKIVSTLLFSLFMLSPLPVLAEKITVAAASDLQFVMREMGPIFEAQTGHSLLFSFGSSGKFSAQIQQGAPFELFLSADEKYIQILSSKNLTQDAGFRYATGRIVLFAPKASALRPELGLSELHKLLKAKKLKHLAIANPQHAPYGRAAREALTAAGLWNELQGHLILAENASQAAQFASSGSTEGGIIPLSLALSAGLKGKGRFSLIPDKMHKPLNQRMVLLRKATAASRSFYSFLQSGSARMIFQKYGFILPGA